MVRLHTGNGHGSTNNKIRRFSTVVDNLGSAITYADSATDGASFTINEDGVYHISFSDQSNSTNFHGISLNSTELTTEIHDITVIADRLGLSRASGAAAAECIAWSGPLYKDDIIRAHTQGGAEGNASRTTFTITKIGVNDLLGVPVPQTAYIKDVKPSGTAGGTFTAGAWQTRDLNTLSGDTEFVSLSSNQFTLQAGKYEIESKSPAFRVNRHQVKLRDTTNSVDALIGAGMLADAASSDNSLSIIEGVLEITATTTYEIQHQCNTTYASAGLGVDSNFSVDSVYTQVKITKLP
jgi:hypothetical protein